MQHILAIKLSYGLVWNLNTRSAVGLKCLGDSSVECGIFYLILISFFYISPTRPSRLWSQFKFEESAPFFGTFKWQKCPRWTSHTGYLLPASCLQPALWSLQWVRPLQWSNPIICPIKPVVFFFFFFYTHCCATCCLIGAKQTGPYTGSGSISPAGWEPGSRTAWL